MSESGSEQGNKRQNRTIEAQTAQSGASVAKKARLDDLSLAAEEAKEVAGLSSGKSTGVVRPPTARKPRSDESSFGMEEAKEVVRHPAPQSILRPLTTELLKPLQAFFESFAHPIQPKHCVLSTTNNTVTIQLNQRLDMLSVTPLGDVYWCEFPESVPLSTVHPMVDFMKENMATTTKALLRAFLPAAKPSGALYVVRKLRMIEVSLMVTCSVSEPDREIYVHTMKQ